MTSFVPGTVTLYERLLLELLRDTLLLDGLLLPAVLA